MKEKQALAREVGKRYRAAEGKEKSVILGEFVETTGYHPKYALRVLNRKEPAGGERKAAKSRPKNRLGKKTYGEEVTASLRKIWSFHWYKCGKILAALLRDQMDCIADWPDFGITPEIREKLLRISPATIDRALAADRAALAVRGKSLTKAAKPLKTGIPIRTFYSPMERETPGFLQIDTVHHCGQTTSGEYLLTLTATDVSSGWVFLCPLLNKAHRWTHEALQRIHETIPFPFREFHSDNGSEFINHAIEKWCSSGAHPIPFTRSRDRKKNDNCFVEQKNGACVREYVGYYRLADGRDLSLLSDVYRPLEPLLNFFMPTMRLVGKVRIGSKEIKKYDSPRSPYTRLMEKADLPDETREALQRRQRLYNPVVLQQNVNNAILALQDAAVCRSSRKGGPGQM